MRFQLVRLFVCLALTASATVAHADVVTSWNAAALDAIRAARTAPPTAARALAILHIAVYDAVIGIRRTHEPYYVQSTVPASASLDAAASAAAHSVLVVLLPGASLQFDELHAATLATVVDGPRKDAGIAWGEFVATQILWLRAADGSDDVVTPRAVTGAGAWIPTPPAFAPYLLPQWAFVTPFAMPASASFRPLGPPALTSARYTVDFNEVKALGAAVGSTRDAEQTQIARFWADGAGTETPAGHWNRIARAVAFASGNTLEANARLFALLNIAQADAAISAWDAKYAFMFWRPVTAIRGADNDGNPQTAADATWVSLIPTPPFPDYVSGHSTFSGAAATVLAHFFGSDRITLAVESDALPGVSRSFSSFSAAAREAAISRLYGGIHFRSANEDGLASGIAIGEWVSANIMQPKGNRSRR